jgi:hypothetical protein
VAQDKSLLSVSSLVVVLRKERGQEKLPSQSKAFQEGEKIKEKILVRRIEKNIMQ